MRTTNRSKLMTLQTCPTLHYWKWHAFGTGVEAVKSPIPLQVGRCVHLGMEKMLEAIMGYWDANEIPKPVVATAIQTATSAFDEWVKSRGLMVDGEGEENQVVREQRELIRALLYSWALRGAPELLSQYVVLAVEMELSVPWGDDLVFQARPDAILLHRYSDELFVGSWKTKATWSKLADDEALHDDQGVSEAHAVDYLLKETWHSLQRRDPTTPLEVWLKPQLVVPQVMGVHMEFLLKGSRDKVKDSPGVRFQNTPLLRAYTRPGITPDEDEWAFNYWYTCERSHIKSVGKTGKPSMCEGFKLHRLTDDWRPVFIPDVCDVLDWVDKLNSGGVQPGQDSPLPGMFISRIYYRNQREIKAWVSQGKCQEDVVQVFLGTLRDRCEEQGGVTSQDIETILPQHRRSCIQYGRRCEFYPVCWEGVWPDPQETGFYMVREPHHPEPISSED